MKVELHLHTSRYSGCAIHSPTDMMRRLVIEGYEAAYITEHDAVWPDNEIAELQAAFPQLRIFPGVELSIGDFWSLQHLLVLGTNDPQYLALSRLGSPNVEEILSKASAAGHLTVLAHPCRWKGGDDMIRRGLLPDALEARTCNQDGRASRRAREIAQQRHLPVVNAGDVHSAEMIGRFWIETSRPITRAEEVREIILAGQYANLPTEADEP